MGKGTEWSISETEQLAISWSETSENLIRGANQKRQKFTTCLYEHWKKNKSAADQNDRTEIAIIGRWKKILPEITEFCGIYAKLKSKERSGWNEAMYVENACKIYAERYNSSFGDLLSTWQILRNNPKWIAKLSTMKSNKRKSRDETEAVRPVGTKAAKEAYRNDKEVRAAAPTEDAVPADPHLRFVAASEKKARVMEQQLHFNIFMQAPASAESQLYFAAQRKAILAQLALSDPAPPTVPQPALDEAHNLASDQEEDDDSDIFHPYEPTQLQRTTINADDDEEDTLDDDLQCSEANEVISI
jgi:hypothetical protein